MAKYLSATIISILLIFTATAQGTSVPAASFNIETRSTGCNVNFQRGCGTFLQVALCRGGANKIKVVTYENRKMTQFLKCKTREYRILGHPADNQIEVTPLKMKGHRTVARGQTVVFH